jgi:hypothetical protein
VLFLIASIVLGPVRASSEAGNRMRGWGTCSSWEWLPLSTPAASLPGLHFNHRIDDYTRSRLLSRSNALTAKFGTNMINSTDLVKPESMMTIKDPETKDLIAIIYIGENREHLIYKTEKAVSDDIAELLKAYLKASCKKNESL